MQTKLKLIISLLTVIDLGSLGLWLSNRYTPSKASVPIYRSMTASMSTQENKPFTDLKCIGVAGDPEFRGAFILRDTNHVNPKGVKYRDVLVAQKIVNQDGTFYGLKAVDYRKGECDVYYTSIEDGEESNPLSRVFSPQHALEIQLIWDKWRLANIPNWKAKMQKYLNRPKVQLAKEEYLSLKQLGFKMPKKWEEVK